MKHTQGPWRVRESALYKDGTVNEVNPNLPHYVCEYCNKQAKNPHPTAIQINAKGWGVAHLLTLDPVGEFEQHMANARVIAAAPELLERLELAVRELTTIGRTPQTVAICNDTIAKARGA